MFLIIYALQKPWLGLHVLLQNLSKSWDVLKVTGIPHFIALWFIVLERIYILYKLKEIPTTSKKITTHFVVILALSQWSGTEPVILWGISVLRKISVYEILLSPSSVPFLTLVSVGRVPFHCSSQLAKLKSSFKNQYNCYYFLCSV